MSRCTIIKAGLHTSIQGNERLGYRDQGVPLSGPMDRHAHNWANKILGNEISAPALECTWLGPTIVFHQETTICVFGAIVDIVINGNQKLNQNIIHLQKGDQLSFGKIHTGYRFYIAFPQGIHIEPTLGSTSYDSISKLGPSIIKKGDGLNFGDQTTSLLDMDTVPTRSIHRPISCYPGPEFHLLEKYDLNDMNFNVMPSSNRMAYQLQSSNTICHAYEMISSPVLPGTIQLTPSGQWMVLMRDAQTTGGYPRILQLVDDDIDLLAQYRPGKKVILKLK